MFGRSLLDGLELPIRNRFGLRPARTADGSPAPLKKDASVDAHAGNLVDSDSTETGRRQQIRVAWARPRVPASGCTRIPAA
jgi:hypothetical protein